MNQPNDVGGLDYGDANPKASHQYLLPKVRSILDTERKRTSSTGRLFDLGCGNGSVSAALAKSGFNVTGVDSSEAGINQARMAYPGLRFECASAYDDLALQYGRFDYVVSLEVVEHVFAPRKYAETLYKLVDEGGIAIISTPYHGYIKNLALALTSKMDRHFTALWDHGHIKFWSIMTLRVLLTEAGFRQIDFYRVGRIPPLAKSMIAVARR